MENKYCRVCWNIDGWRKPSGVANETGGSYVAKHRFGHEEWLFNYEWCLDGYKYGFLEPFRKIRGQYEGQNCAVALYTKAPVKSRKETLLVASIQHVYIPTSHELRAVFKKMKSRGWIKQMLSDVAAVDAGPADLASAKPELTINVRFRPKDVVRYDPMPLFPADHPVARAKRYKALPWDGGDLPDDVDVDVDDPAGSELPITRAAQKSTIVDRQHIRLQKRLFKSLAKRFGKKAVHRERNWVDLTVCTSDGDIFYEIKTASSAKQCIREALGQLFEYAVYPTKTRARQWIVVGSAYAEADDILYLEYLRSQFSIPVYYARFDWETEDIGEPV